MSLVDRACRVTSARGKAPADCVLHTRGECNAKEEIPKVEKLRDVACNELVHADIDNPSMVRESVMNLPVRSTGHLVE